eukprot:TRINITY_DN39771_c0_g1_i1.p1 TRINITY_DN39771_c0_g1~~TRINITY_DN39771_c0_g1_i1.p1  ORF type:complete len:473 (+),score=76.16 TRINITY_DN39771_c0_g1_i1:118-1536(+)
MEAQSPRRRQECELDEPMAMQAGATPSTARSPGKAPVQKMKGEAKKKGRKKAPSAEGTSPALAASPGPGVADPFAESGRPRGTLSSASSSSQNSMSPGPSPAAHKAPGDSTPRAATTPVATTPLHGFVQALPRPRPGGLLDAMRQRGTLPATGLASQAPAPGVVPAIPRTFGSCVTMTSTSSTAVPTGHSLASCSRAVSSTGSNCSAGSAPAASPTPCKAQSAGASSPAAAMPCSPAKPTSQALDCPQSPLLPRALEAASPGGPARKRSREDDTVPAEVTAPTKSKAPARKRSDNKAETGLPASPARARQEPGSPAPSPRVRAETPARSKRPPVPTFKKPPPEPEPWQLVRQIKLPPKDPEDNYELSDKGSDSEAEEPDRLEKHTPAWSLKYLELIEAQADIDADTIFGCRVPHCDLEAIFLDRDYMKFQQDRPKRKRGSSGEWRRDRLSRAEICEYKRKMGHNRRWEAMMA